MSLSNSTMSTNGSRQGSRGSHSGASREFSRNYGASQRTQKAKLPRPNYFIAVQVNDSKVLEKAKEIQDTILRNASRNLSHMIVDVRTSHLTLMAMHLGDSFAKQSAIECLDQCVATLKGDSEYGPITLEFEGLDVFNGGSVLFITIKQSPALQVLTSIADVITRNMEKRDILAAGHKFNPHMSLMKYSWEKGPRHGARKVERNNYSMYEKEYLGTHTISSIQLCQMNSEREDGYYVVEYEVFL